jgi:HEAT repeat protein
MRRLILSAAVVACVATAPAFADRADVFLEKSASEWMKDLASGKVEARRAAAFALGKLGAQGNTKAIVAGLLKRLRDDQDAGVRERAAEALGDVFTALEETAAAYWTDAGPTLQKALENDPDARVRRSCACALGAFGPGAAEAQDVLTAALADRTPSVRQNAAWALGRLGKDAGPAAVEGLRGLLKDAEPLVRRDAAAALGEVGRPAARPGAAALFELLGEEKDGVVRRTVLQALSQLAGPEDKGSTSVLVKILEDASADEETRWDAAFVLAGIGGPDIRRAVPPIQEALKGDDPHLQELAAAAAARLGPAAKSIVEDLGKVLTAAKEPSARRNAAVALAKIGPDAKAALPALVEVLRRKDDPAEGSAETRVYVAEALASIKFPSNEAALPAILEVLRDDPQPLVRQRCVWALFELSDLAKHKAVGPLTEVLNETAEDDNLLVRYDAARVLALRLGASAPDRTVDVLLHMLKNDRLLQFNGTDVKGGVDGENKSGKTGVNANQGGDARFMAAKALGWLGKKGSRKDVVDALQEAAQSADKRLSDAAKEALRALKP